MSAAYTTAHGNVRSLTHRARPGIEPATSWFLVRFVSAAPSQELLKGQNLKRTVRNPTRKKKRGGGVDKSLDNAFLDTFYIQKEWKTKKKIGVPIAAQWLRNPTRNHEVSGSIPGLAQCIKDPALL